MSPLDQLSPDELAAQPNATEGGAKMGFLEHLEELRRRVFRAFIWVVAAMIPAFAYQDQILHFLIGPVEKAMGTLSVITPAEAFLNKFKAAFAAALVLALPAVVYELWSFISPGLMPKEKRWVMPVMLVASILFLTGAGFAYWFVVPGAAKFLAEQGQEFQQHITVTSAFGFGAKLLLGLGAMFEMPLVIFALTRLGIVSAGFLWRKIGIAIFIIFALSAVLTPTPDIFTMTVFALPLVGLYLISIGVAWAFEPRTGSSASKSPPSN
ncbi:MAG: twin-arginine translocase subunit TatC [Acidobacteriota bacterium]